MQQRQRQRQRQRFVCKVDKKRFAATATATISCKQLGLTLIVNEATEAKVRINHLASQGIIVGAAASDGSQAAAAAAGAAQQQQSPQHKLLLAGSGGAGAAVVGAECVNGAGAVKLRNRTTTPDAAKSHASYRISMANLEDTQESELDLILGELSLLDAQVSYQHQQLQQQQQQQQQRQPTPVGGLPTPPPPPPSAMYSSSSAASSRTHSRTNSSISGDVSTTSGCFSSAGSSSEQTQTAPNLALGLGITLGVVSSHGASKSLLVDERMGCGHVTRLLADKNHVQMQPHWALIEHLGDMQMGNTHSHMALLIFHFIFDFINAFDLLAERLFEDHELLVDNLMTWNSDAGNRVLFQQRADKLALFAKPELYLPGPQLMPGYQHDEQTRHMLLEEFFETQSQSQLQLDGPLYMKADAKKGWKRYHFVLRASGLYYFPKEKTKNTRDLACLTLFSGHNVYTGIGWRKKWKSPTDYTFGFKSATDSSLAKSCRSLKMLCAEDGYTLDRWLTAIRICKYGKQLWHSHKLLLEELGGSSNGLGSFAASMRSESISSISSAVPSQCGSVSSAISSMSNSSGRISRASSSSSSGCLSDENNAFDSEFTTGTIKRKPSMKPNLPLTTMTRQLKEVGEITTGAVAVATVAAGSAAVGDTHLAASPERSGTLTRRHSRRKSQESNGSGTLKRRPVVVVAAPAAVKRDVLDSAGSSSSSSSNSTPTPTPSICAKAAAPPPPPPPALSDVELMCSSTLSLDSLPPPPPADEQDVYGSQLSLASLPPPPPPEEVLAFAEPTTPTPMSMSMGMGMGMCLAGLPNSNGSLPPAVPAKPIKPAVKQTLKAAPPYKAPPDYVPAVPAHPAAPAPAPVQKKVSFADSPVLLRRKMCSPEPQLPLRSPSTVLSAQPIYSPGPLLPPRSDLLRLSNGSESASMSSTSPKRLQESASNPPRDFLKDLQRVMRKKWQVAQKCKLEPATTPHEVLGFRDFNNEDLLAAHNLNSGANSSHYYRETANVSHWVQEHYEYAHNEYALYENVHAQSNGGGNTPTATDAGPPAVPPPAAIADAMAALRKKRPPPPPPKRSDSTHLTHRV
ncbi:pico [Drosophila busckii]|uniref:Pico n=1 Tax=Drosophila busckii TaxID=30019 RepID=A0A0M4ESE3_DROBS|nr:pico [Drosophila busckii]